MTSPGDFAYPSRSRLAVRQKASSPPRVLSAQSPPAAVQHLTPDLEGSCACGFRVTWVDRRIGYCRKCGAPVRATELNNPERARLGCVLAMAIERGQTEASERELDLVAALRECQAKAMSYRGRIKRLMLELNSLRSPATDEEINRSFDVYR